MTLTHRHTQILLGVLAALLLGRCAPPEPPATPSATPTTVSAPATSTTVPPTATATPTAAPPTATPTETPTPAPSPEALTEDALRNAVYELPDLGEVALVDGAYERVDEEDPAIVDQVGIGDVRATGDLNGDGAEDAAVVLWHNTGGSGTWIYLVAVANADGHPQQVAFEALGDRTSVLAMTITDGTLAIEMLTHRADDPACCPSLEVHRRYRLLAAGWSLVEETAGPVILRPEQVTFDASDVSNSVASFIAPAEPYDPTVPPAMNGVPMHVTFMLSDVPALEDLETRPMELRIYPLDAYAALYEGTAAASELEAQVAALRELLDARPDDPAAPLPLLPAQGAVEVFHAQVAYLDFEDGAGVRFVTQYALDAGPVTQASIFYTFQGLTADGRFWISFVAPVITPVLPASYEESPAAEDPEGFGENFAAYLEETVAALNAATFAPELSALDAMIASLDIEVDE